MSWHDAESELSLLNRAAYLRPVEVHPWTYEVVSTALELSRLTNGAFDISVGKKLMDWGYLPADKLRREAHCASGDHRDIELGGGRSVSFRCPLLIDLGGIAKGFAVDKAVEELQRLGVPSGTVNAGGDLRVFGDSAEKIVLRSPSESMGFMPLTQIQSEALATSVPALSVDESSGSTVSSLLRGRNLAPIVDRISISVRAASCMIADALTKIVADDSCDCIPVLALFGASAYKFHDGEMFQLVG